MAAESAEGIVRTLCAFLGTYLVHSTLLLCAAWLACALLARHGSRAGALREGLWRTALFGAIATSVLALAVPGLGVRIDWPALDLPLAPLESVRNSPRGLHMAGALATNPPPIRHATLAALSLPAWLALAWALGAGLAAARLARGWLELRRALLNSRRVSDPRALALLSELCGNEAPPDLRTTSAIGAPITCGWLWPAILLPERALDELGESELRALLAHELGHVQRGDALWLTLYGAISTLFFFQPLNRLARARLAHEAELACDDAAIASGAERLGLARCLTEVAGWLVRGREREKWPAASMAARGKSLTERVERLLDDAHDPAPKHRLRGALPLGVATLAAVTLLAPALSITRADAGALHTGPVHAALDAAPESEITLMQVELLELGQGLDTIEALALEAHASDTAQKRIAGLRAQLEQLELELAAIEAALEPQAAPQIPSSDTKEFP